MKYRITSETKVVDNITLHRIECVTAFGDVECGGKDIEAQIKHLEEIKDYPGADKKIVQSEIDRLKAKKEAKAKSKSKEENGVDDAMPWASKVKAVCCGYMGFESEEDYRIFCNQK